MATGRRTLYPPAALEWLVGDRAARVLDLGSGNGANARLLTELGHEVFCIDRDVQAVASLPARLGTRLHVAGQVESLPYLSCHFDVVSSSANLHRFAPGLALSEIARVLKPGGVLAVAYNVRDDTVPWVKRLAALLREVDPNAMTGAYGVESVQAVTDSPYFSEVAHRDFRNWVPIDRAGLLAMVERRPETAKLDVDTRERLLADVGALYDSSARPPEPLLLPYRASCWRALVDHSALAIVDDEPDVMQISLS
jgi:SAM-dependent methyltransferase